MTAKVLDIKEVPPSPHTGFMPTSVYNPLSEDFTHSWDNVPYTIPAGETKSFPEFIARHLAKHLAQKIVQKKWEFKIKKDAVGQITPDTAKAVPLIEVQTMMEALLLGKEAFEKIEAVPEPVILAPELASEPTPAVTPIIEPKVEEPKIEPKVEEPKVETNPLKCSVCGFVAKNNTGLAVHKRFRHPK